MIARDASQSWLVRFAAPWVWRNRQRVARKLAGFSATEAGSALDMLKAAELETEPERRRRFFRHAMDEARHAEMFRRNAQALAAAPTGELHAPYAQIHAERQNLYQQLGPLSFIAFVYLAERRGQAHFAALARHFDRAHDAGLRDLFERIEKDERFHVAYSGKLLRRWSDAGGARQVSRALLRIRLTGGWQAWRRAGRRIGDALTRLVLATVYFVALPGFALAVRWLEPSRPGWKTARSAPTWDLLRRQW